MDGEEVISAVREGNLERVQELIGDRDLGTPPDIRLGWYLVCEAVEAGHRDIVKLLLDKGANVNVAQGEYTRNLPLATAVRKRDIEIVQLLLSKGAKVEAEGNFGPTPLGDAITLGDINIVRLLLDNKADLYDSFFKYSSALDHASKYEKPEIVDLLISRGAKMGKTRRFSFDDTSSSETNSSYDNSTNNIYTDYDSDNSDEDGMNPLHVAVQRGYVHLVEHYLKQGSSVNSTCNLRRKRWYTPLHLACEKHKKEVFETLLRYGADVNLEADRKLTALHIAVKRKKADFAEMLLLCGASVDAVDGDNRTALYLAAGNRDIQTVKVILKYGPDVNNDSNKSALRAAVLSHGKNCEDTIRHLLSYGFTSKTESTDEEVLHGAVQKGFMHFVDDFLKGTDVNAALRDSSEGREGYTLLHTACEEDNMKMIKYLMLKGSEVNARSLTDLTPLHVAARAAHGHVFELLLNNGANIDDQDKEGKSALYFAALNGNISAVKSILKRRPRIDYERNPLCAAVICDYFDERKVVIEDLVSYGFTVTAKDADEHLFLHNAVIKGDIKIVTDLLKYTTEDHLSKYRSNEQSTPLHYAAMNRQREVVELLLKHGAGVNDRDFEGATPMSSLIYGTTRYIQSNPIGEDPEELDAIQRKCMEIIEILLQNGADPKIVESESMTVLHYTAACNVGMEEIAKLFLKKGVDVKIASEKGATPLSIATYKGNRSLARLFLEHGGLDFSRKTDRKVLQFACQHGYDEYFSIPLELDLADINSVDHRGATALYFAHDKKDERLIRYLLEYGADINVGRQLRDIDNNFSPSADVIKWHIVKLYTAGLKVPLYDFLLQDYEMINLAEECREELKRMRNEKIADTIVSFCDILTEDMNQLAAYAENESVISSVKGSECELRFPLYSSVLKGFLWKGVVRRGLLDKSKGIFRYYCSGLRDLPDVCLKKILEYLTDQDLRGFIRSHQDST